MNTPTVTPEQIQETRQELDSMLGARLQDIVALRKKDPEYWSLSRLAKRWKTSRQTIRTQLNKAGIDTSQG